MKIIKNTFGFTILELMISMTLFALIITGVILAVQSMSIARIKAINRIALTEELYSFSEQFFTKIKEGGTLDYEEYWNRQAVSLETQSGYYMHPTGVGNYGKNGILGTAVYGSGIYLCRSNDGTLMGTGGCLEGFNNGSSGTGVGSPVNFSGTYQRYGQYVTQFTDYNGNKDADMGDENSDGSITGDDDDRVIGDVAPILSGSTRELYLINKNAKTRTYFRWYIKQDPGTSTPCTIVYTATGTVTGLGCLGNIQVLRLGGIDVGFSHVAATTDKTSYDGVIDTWVCTESSLCISSPSIGSTGKKIATGQDAEWINLFPSTVNVKRLSFDLYPVKDPWLSWYAPDCDQADMNCKSPFIHPYVRVNMDMGFSWGKRRTLKNDDPTISIATSVSLSDFE